MLNSYIIIVHCIPYHTSNHNAAGALVYSSPRIRRLLELQLTLPSTTAAVPILPQCFPGHPEGAGLHHLRGERDLVTAAE